MTKKNFSTDCFIVGNIDVPMAHFTIQLWTEETADRIRLHAITVPLERFEALQPDSVFVTTLDADNPDNGWLVPLDWFKKLGADNDHFAVWQDEDGQWWWRDSSDRK